MYFNKFHNLGSIISHRSRIGNHPTTAVEPQPKRPKTQTSSGNVMATVVWYAHGTLFIDYLPQLTRIFSRKTIFSTNLVSKRCRGVGHIVSGRSD